MTKYAITCLLACCAATARGQQQPKDSTVFLDTIKVTAAAGPVPYQPSAPRVWEIIHTRIALSFDRMAKTAAAKEWIKLRPYFYATDTIVLDAKSMKIDSVLLAGRKGGTPLRYTYENDQLKIWLGKQYAATDTIELGLRYTAMPYATKAGGSAAITDDRGLYFINTDNRTPGKQAHIWTQGETEANSHWMITIDKPNTRFTTEIELTVPDSLVTLSNGALVKQVKAANGGMRTDIWKMDMPIQAYAVMFAISRYAVVKDKWRGKEVNYYVEPQYAPYAKLMFRYTPEMMEFFSQKTGVSYPWNKYSQVVVRDYVSGAMENTTASLFGEFMNQDAREIADKDYEDIVAHELFHQWFGDYVTCESWSNTTLNESFANYGEQLWRTFKHGKTSGEELAWNDLQLYIAASRGKDPQLVRYHYDSREELFDAISYNKGGATLHYLHYLMGDAAFSQSMKLYLTRNALHSAEAHQWRLAVEEVTGQDWNWFFDEWYYHAGHPVLKFNYNYNDSALALTVDVTQAQDDSLFNYRLPLKTSVLYGSDISVVDWTIHKHNHTFTFPYKNGQKPVIIPDNAHILPGEVKENKKPAQWLTQYMYAPDYISRRLAVGGAGKQLSDSSSQAVLDMAFNDSLYQVRRYALAQVEKASSDKYRKRWAAKVMDLAANDHDNHVRAEAFDVLGAWKTPAARPLLLRSVYDSSYMVAASALEALDKQDKDTAYALAKQLLAAKPGGALDGAVWTIMGKKGDATDIEQFEKKATTVHGSKRLSFGLAVGNYMKNVTSDDAFKRAAKVYGDLAVYETMKSYRSAIGGFFFQAVSVQKGLLKDEDKDKAARAETRMKILKQEAARLVSEERDEEQKEKFVKMMKENFEE